MQKHPVAPCTALVITWRSESKRRQIAKSVQQFTGMAWHALPAFDQTQYTVAAAAAAAVRLRGIGPSSAPPEANHITTKKYKIKHIYLHICGMHWLRNQHP